MQVTKGTVDEGIHAMAERKLRLDAAVLDGVTAAADGKGGSTAAATVQVHCMSSTCRAAAPLILSWRSLTAMPLKEAIAYDLTSRDMRCAPWYISGTPCLQSALAPCEPKASPNLLADLWSVLQMSELLQSLLSRTTGPDETSRVSRETHEKDDREMPSANDKAGTQVGLEDLT